MKMKILTILAISAPLMLMAQTNVTYGIGGKVITTTATQNTAKTANNWYNNGQIRHRTYNERLIDKIKEDSLSTSDTLKIGNSQRDYGKKLAKMADEEAKKRNNGSIGAVSQGHTAEKMNTLVHSNVKTFKKSGATAKANMAKEYRDMPKDDIIQIIGTGGTSGFGQTN